MTCQYFYWPVFSLLGERKWRRVSLLKSEISRMTHKNMIPNHYLSRCSILVISFLLRFVRFGLVFCGLMKWKACHEVKPRCQNI